MKARTILVSILLPLGALAAACQARQQPPAEQNEAVTTDDAGGETGEQLAAKKAALERQLAELEQKERALAAEKAPAGAPAPTPRRAPQPGSHPPAPAEEHAPAQAPPPAPPAPEVVSVTVPAGTELDLEITTPLSSETSQPGDGFAARVVADVVVDGKSVIPAGTVVEGFVRDVQSTSKKIGGTARLELDFDRIVLPNGETSAVQMAFVAAGRSQSGKDAATIGGAAAGGALLGRLLKKKDKSKGTLIGALLGGAIGAAIAANNPGDPVEIPEGTVLPVRLEDPLSVTLVDGRPTFSGTATDRTATSP